MDGLLVLNDQFVCEYNALERGARAPLIRRISLGSGAQIVSRFCGDVIADPKETPDTIMAAMQLKDQADYLYGASNS